MHITFARKKRVVWATEKLDKAGEKLTKSPAFGKWAGAHVAAMNSTDSAPLAKAISDTANCDCVNQIGEKIEAN